MIDTKEFEDQMRYDESRGLLPKGWTDKILDIQQRSLKGGMGQ